MAGQARAEVLSDAADTLLSELEVPATSSLEELVQKGSPLQAKDGFASYYARRFEGRKTFSGQRYHPEKMTGAHQSLPMGTVVRVVDVFVPVEPCFGIASYHHLGFELPDDARKFLAQWDGGFEFAIRVVQENCLFDSKQFVGGPLFALADGKVLFDKNSHRVNVVAEAAPKN